MATAKGAGFAAHPTTDTANRLAGRPLLARSGWGLTLVFFELYNRPVHYEHSQPGPAHPARAGLSISAPLPPCPTRKLSTSARGTLAQTSTEPRRRARIARSRSPATNSIFQRETRTLRGAFRTGWSFGQSSVPAFGSAQNWNPARAPAASRKAGQSEARNKTTVNQCSLVATSPY